MPHRQDAEIILRSVMRGFRLCAWPLLAVAVALAVASVYYTVTNLAIRTSRNDLVASNQRLIQQTEKMDRAFGGRDGMVVVVENGHPKRAIKFADELATELRRYPDHFPELFYKVDPERFKRSALLYLEPQDLDKIKDGLLKQEDLLAGLAADPRLTTFYRLVNDRITRSMIGELFTGFLADKEKLELPDLSVLNASLRGLSASLEGRQPQDSLFSSFFPKELSDLEGSGYFFTENDKYLLFLVTPKGDGYASRSQDLALLRKVVDQVKVRYPGLEAGVTGPDALEADEMSSSMKDVTLATWLSLAGQMGLLILFLRSLRRTLVEGLVLVLGLCWTFGLVTLVVGHLNLLSLIFAPLMLGLTVDYGIHWFCRLEEEQGSSRHCSARGVNPDVAPVGAGDCLCGRGRHCFLCAPGFRGLQRPGGIGSDPGHGDPGDAGGHPAPGAGPGDHYGKMLAVPGALRIVRLNPRRFCTCIGTGPACWSAWGW